MNKTLKVIVKVLVPCIVVAGLGYGGYRFYQSRKAISASSGNEIAYDQVQIGTGNLEKTVTGTGTLSISETKDVTLDFPVQVTNVYVSAGEQVSAGDPLMNVDKNALNTAITTLESELTTAEDSLAQFVRSTEDDTTLTIGAAGRVKAIYATVGDLTQDVMEKNGALMLLSMDGKMKVSIPTTDLTVGQTLTVMDGQTKYTGTVENISGDMATITFSDIKALNGANIQVVLNSVILGKGTAEINMPFLYTTTTQGRISKIYQSVNSSVSRKSSLFYLTQVPVSDGYTTLVNQRDTILQKLKDSRSILASGIITSPIDGIVSSVTSASTIEVAANTALATLYSGNAKQMVVSVDELDIINVKKGQEVTIEMDAITDKTYDATVSYISQIGSSSSGVTTYNVTLDVQGDDQLKIAMNGTATISVGDAEGVVLVPIAALNTSKDGQYVWLYSPSLPEDSQEPGVKTFVTTDLSSDKYAEVKSGLKSGDYVMITRSANTTETTNLMMDGMGIMPNIEGGQMPSSGQMPSGGQMPNFGGQMPSSDRQRPSN